MAAEGLHDVRVELGAGLGAQDADRLAVGTGRTVGTRRGDRVERVRDGDDAGAQRDLLAPQSIRVAGAVEPLVVVADHPDQLGVAEHRGHLGALAGVELDDAVLLVGQRAGLVQDRLRRLGLADVVQGSRCANSRDLLGGKPHVPRDHPGVARDPARVPVQVGVARLHAGHEPLEQPGLLAHERGVDTPAVARRSRQRRRQLGGVAELPLRVQAVQVAPHHQLAEQKVLGALVALPGELAGPRGAERERHAEGEGDRGRFDGAGLAQPPHRRDRHAGDEQRRERDLRELLRQGGVSLVPHDLGARLP